MRCILRPPGVQDLAGCCNIGQFLIFFFIFYRSMGRRKNITLQRNGRAQVASFSTSFNYPRVHRLIHHAR
jgi:hypothetical protein